ncbi:MAG TPA: TetR/AcrR family transcriptional regulator [Burkholderiaceae bacterium]|nr:TetR/AcrR family transcriptional regulator [Burkholderiaceae bacterium]
MSQRKYGKPRSTYRHGNLKQALLLAGLDMAREHGPEGVVLREATRRAGVAFNAAYRHYKGQPDLLDAVRAAALGKVARTMEAELAKLGPQPQLQPKPQPMPMPMPKREPEPEPTTEAHSDPGSDSASASADYARRSLRAIGKGYLRFAREEPGLFRTAFVLPVSPETRSPHPAGGESGLDPFQLLSMALDRMLDAGILDANQRPDAEFLAWSAVHGMAMLLLDGPLRTRNDAQLDMLTQRLLTMVERGLQN